MDPYVPGAAKKTRQAMGEPTREGGNFANSKFSISAITNGKEERVHTEPPPAS